jgi:hypothetical protein
MQKLEQVLKYCTAFAPRAIEFGVVRRKANVVIVEDGL